MILVYFLCRNCTPSLKGGYTTLEALELNDRILKFYIYIKSQVYDITNGLNKKLRCILFYIFIRILGLTLKLAQKNTNHTPF